MTVNKRSKNGRQRGHKTHGWGAKKKHRGKGHQGGAGMAGTGKRADSKKPSIWKDQNYFGKHGFISKSTSVKINAINLCDLEQQIHKYTKKNLVKHENGVFVIELSKLGYNKLLGSGSVSTKLRVITPYASASAVEKIQKAGGKVEGLLESSKE